MSAWGGPWPQYTPPGPPAHGAQGEGALPARGGGRVGRGRGRRGRVPPSSTVPLPPSAGAYCTRSQTQNALNIATSSNAGHGDDGHNDAEDDDSDYESDNDSGVITFASSTCYCFFVMKHVI